MGQSSSRPHPEQPEQPPARSYQRRRLRARQPRPTSFFDGSLRSRLSPPDEHNDQTAPPTNLSAPPARSRPRSVFLPDFSSRSWAERQHIRSHSRPRSTRHISPRRRPTLAARLFNRHRAEDERDTAAVTQQWNIAPRDSLDMAHAARERASPRLPEIPQEPLSLDVNEASSAPLVPQDASFQDLPPLLQDSRPSSGLAHRISSLTPARREFSRLTSVLRRRRTRHSLPPDQGEAVLQQLLNFAALATAASLTGNQAEDAANDLRDFRRTAMAIDGENGSFDNFLQALRNRTSTTQLGRNEDDRTPSGNGENNAVAHDNQNSLDYFRMFRFGPSSEPGLRNSAPSAAAEVPAGHDTHRPNHDISGREPDTDDASESGSRTVSVLIVGIRSLNQDSETPGAVDAADAMPSFIDALTNRHPSVNVRPQFPSPDTPIGTPRSNPSLSSWRRARRASMGGLFNGRDRTRLARPGRPVSEIGPSTSLMPDLAESPTASPTAERPPSADNITIEQENRSPVEPSAQEIPIVEPTTTSNGVPPSPVSSRLRFRDTRRDSWRQSWRESWHSSRASNRRSIIDEVPEEELGQPAARWRRTAHTLRFGSGASRRNGVVEPDHLPSDTESTRSWIIYVLGGRYPENHPILTTPSLFSDNPTYEDMLLLSSLLGPAKPPVAQQQDVEASGGLFRILVAGERLLARAVHEDGDDGFIETLDIDLVQDCQICLSAYNEGEVARRLKGCKHLFHKECIDEVCLPQSSLNCLICANQL